MEKKKDKLMLNDLLSWKDVYELGNPFSGNKLYLGTSFFMDCSNTDYDYRRFVENYNKTIVEGFKERFPECKFSLDMFDLHYIYTKDNGKWKLKCSLGYFVAALYGFYRINSKFEEKESDLLAKAISSGMDLKTFARDFLQAKKKYINNAIKAMDNKPNSVFQINTITGKRAASDDKEYMFDVRTQIVYCLKHLDEMFEYLSSVEIPVECLEYLSKDKFIINYVGSCIADPRILNYCKKEVSDEKFVSMIDNDSSLRDALNYINNYWLMIEYLKAENGCEYESNIKFRNGNSTSLLTSGELLRISKPIIDFLDKYPQYRDYTSYEELLSTRASETWKKIQNKKLVNNIKLNFEMITSGTKIKLEPSSSRTFNRVYSNSEKKQAKLKKDYDLLDQKFDYYSQTNPVMELVGINNFTGYFAQFFKNGTVVLDKYYRYGKDRRGNDVMVPAGDEAIYVMNHKEFADLSKYTKPELVEEIRCFNQDVKRIYHRGEWTKRVDKEINGSGYGELDLDFLNQLTNALSMNKTLIK